MRSRPPFKKPQKIWFPPSTKSNAERRFSEWIMGEEMSLDGYAFS